MRVKEYFIHFYWLENQFWITVYKSDFIALTIISGDDYNKTVVLNHNSRLQHCYSEKHGPLAQLAEQLTLNQ